MVDHASLTGAALHEPKGVASAASKTVYVANGSGSGSWTTLDFNTIPTGMPIGFEYTQSQAASTQTSQIPNDSTIPQNTEGTEVMTVSITPKSATSILKVEVLVQGAEMSNSSDVLTVALFKDSETDARAASQSQQSLIYGTQDTSLTYYMVAGGTSSITFKVRVGLNNSASWSFNKGATGTLGGVYTSFISVTEIKA